MGVSFDFQDLFANGSLPLVEIFPPVPFLQAMLGLALADALVARRSPARFEWQFFCESDHMVFRFGRYFFANEPY
jgi:hypothetical protein